MAHLGKRYVAVTDLGEPLNVTAGEEFTVTAKLAGERETTLGTMPLIDFDVLLAIGAITAAPAAARPAATKGEAAEPTARG